MAKKIQDGNQIVTNVDSNDNLTFSIKSSFIDSTPTVNSTNLVTSGGVKSALDINTTDIAAAVIRIANNETNISNNTDDIEDLEDAVSTNTTNISTNTTDINSLETTVGTLSTNVNTNTTNIGTLNNLTTTSKTNLVSAINEVNTGDNISERLVSIGSLAPETNEKVWFKTTSGAEGLYVNEELWYSPNNTEKYSTNEIKIGTWIDGKPLYRKVVDIGTLPNATTKHVAHNIANIGSVVTLRGIVTDYRFFPVPFAATSNAYAISIFADSTNIDVMAGNDRSNMTGFAIIEYTKTTD